MLPVAPRSSSRGKKRKRKCPGGRSGPNRVSASGAACGKPPGLGRVGSLGWAHAQGPSFSLWVMGRNLNSENIWKPSENHMGWYPVRSMSSGFIVCFRERTSSTITSRTVFRVEIGSSSSWKARNEFDRNGLKLHPFLFSGGCLERTAWANGSSKEGWTAEPPSSASLSGRWSILPNSLHPEKGSSKNCSDIFRDFHHHQRIQVNLMVKLRDASLVGAVLFET